MALDERVEVEKLIAAAEKLLEWMPIYSKGSSGDIRQTNLRVAIAAVIVEWEARAKLGSPQQIGESPYEICARAVENFRHFGDGPEDQIKRYIASKLRELRDSEGN